MSRTISSACSSSSARWSTTPERRRVQLAPAELLGGDDLADRGLHERRSAEEDRALVADDHRLVAHRGHVGAAGGARAEHRGDLRDALGRHPRLVEEDPPEVVAVGEDLVLHRQERAAGVDEVDAGQPVLERDLLRAQVLLHGQRVVGAALDGRVVADDHHVAAVHQADAGDHARAGRVAVVHARRRRAARSRGTGCPRRAAGRRGRAAAACPGRRGARARPAGPPTDAAASRSRSSAARAAWRRACARTRRRGRPRSAVPIRLPSCHLRRRHDRITSVVPIAMRLVSVH